MGLGSTICKLPLKHTADLASTPPPPTHTHTHARTHSCSLSPQYYTDYAYAPVRSIAEASTTGHGTNIITGVSVGMKSTFIPTCVITVSVICAYHLGAGSGIGDGHNAGLFGTAVATMGMLSTACYILSMNNYGPIADNAGGIAEMSMQPEHVRDATDRLDAAGNVTKAVRKKDLGLSTWLILGLSHPAGT